MKLSEKIVVVTGGSRGISFAIAKLFSENGAKVVITSQDSQRLEKASSEIPNSFGIVANIRKKDQVKNVIDKTIEKFGKLDILVNNAGIFPNSKVRAFAVMRSVYDDEDFVDIVDPQIGKITMFNDIPHREP